VTHRGRQTRRSAALPHVSSARGVVARPTRLRCRDHAKRVTAEQPRPEGADPRGGLVNRSPQPEPGGPPLTDEAHQLGRVRSCRRSGDQRIVHLNAAFPAQDGAHEPHRLYHVPWPRYSRGGSSPRATDRSPIGEEDTTTTTATHAARVPRREVTGGGQAVGQEIRDEVDEEIGAHRRRRGPIRSGPPENRDPPRPAPFREGRWGGRRASGDHERQFRNSPAWPRSSCEAMFEGSLGVVDSTMEPGTIRSGSVSGYPPCVHCQELQGSLALI
jgi:hypothetical protein